MKIILLSVVIFCLSLGNILAEKVITCHLKRLEDQPGCEFSGVTIEKNEAVSIATDPEDRNIAINVSYVQFVDSSIYSLPRKIFEKFPNVEKFIADGQKIHEIKPNTFENGKKLEMISLRNNNLTLLHEDTFKVMKHSNKVSQVLAETYRKSLLIQIKSLKGLTELWKLYLDGNRISAMHKKTFSHLTKLKFLHVGRNVCIITDLHSNINFKRLERDLRGCGERYALYEPEDFEWTSSGEDTEQAINQKFDAIDGKFENLETRFDDLKKALDEHGTEIKEIKKLLEKMVSE